MTYNGVCKSTQYCEINYKICFIQDIFLKSLSTYSSVFLKIKKIQQNFFIISNFARNSFIALNSHCGHSSYLVLKGWGGKRTPSVHFHCYSQVFGLVSFTSSALNSSKHKKKTNKQKSTTGVINMNNVDTFS